MVAVAMGDDCKIEPSEINASRFDVLRQNIWVVAGVEQDALAIHFDERGKAPVLLHGGILAECVVEDSDAGLRGGRSGGQLVPRRAGAATE